MAEGTAVVGRVAIKVMPDSSEFRDGLKDDLRREQAKSKSDPITVPVAPDSDGLTRQIKRAVKEAGEDAGTVEIEVDPDLRGLERALRQIDAEINQPRKIKVVADDIEAARRQIEALREQASINLKWQANTRALEDAREEVQRLLNQRLVQEVDVALDSTALEAKLDRLSDDVWTFALAPEMDETALHDLRERLDDLIDDYDETKLDFEPTVDGINYRYTATRLQILARDRWVKIEPIMDRRAFAAVETALAALSGGRMVTSTLDNLWSMLKNLDKNIPLIGGIALAVMGIANSAISATSNLVALSRSLAQMAQASLLLPGILAGFVVGIAVAIAALKDLNKVLPQIGEGFKALQDGISAEFWQEAKRPFTDLYKTVFPEFAAGAKETATATGHWFGALATSLKNHLGDGALKPMFAALNESINISAGGTESWAQAIEILGRRGSEYLPRFATWFNEISASFANWLNEADKTGEINEWIETGLTNIKDFGRALAGLGSIFAGLGRAAEEAGGASLKTFADGLQSVAKTVNGEPFKSKLVQVFRSAHEAMDIIAETSGPAVKNFFMTFSDTISKSMVNAGDAVGRLVAGVATALSTTRFDDGLTRMLDGLSEAMIRLEPMWPALGDSLGLLMGIIGDLAQNFAPVLAELFEHLRDALERVAPVVDSISDSLSGLLLKAMEDLGPVIVTVVEALADLAGYLIDTPPLLIGLAAAWVAVRGAMAAGSIASGITTVATALGARSLISLGDVTAKLHGFARGLGAVGLAVAGAAIVGDWAYNLGTVTPKVEALSSALERLGEQTTADGIARVRAQIDGLLAGDQGLKGALTGAKDIDSLSAALAHLGEANNWIGDTSWLTGFESWMNNIGPSGHQARLALEGFEQSMIALNESGNIEGFAAGQEALAAAIASSDLSMEQALLLMPTYATLLEDLKLKTQNEAAAARDAADAERLMLDQIRAATGVIPAQVDAINDGSTAFVTFDDKIGDAYNGLGDYMARLQEQVNAQSEWADNMATLAKKGIDQGVLAELSRMGPEGSQLVADLATGTDEQMAEVERLMKAKSEGAVSQSTTEFGKLAGQVNTEMQRISGQVQPTFAKLREDYKTAGANAGQGFIDGIIAKRALAVSASAETGRQAAAALRKSLDEHSPSRVTRSIGAFFSEGLALGILDEADAVSKAAEKVAAVATDGLSGIDAGIDVNARAARGSVAQAGESGGNKSGGDRTFIYHAAPGASIDSQEDLFTALNRGRGFGF